MKQINLNTILWIAIAVLLTLQLQSLFRGSKSPPDISGEVEARDQIDKMIIEDRDYWRGKYDSVIASISRKIETNEGQIKANKKVYDKIIPAVTDYNREQLRAAAKGYTLPAN